MRPLEFIGWLIAVVPVLALVGIFPLSLGVGASVVSGCILLAAALWIGAYWQLLPLYAAVLLGCVGLLAFKHDPYWKRLAAGGAVGCLLGLTAVFTCVLPMFHLPEPTGPYAVGTRIVHLVDPVRMETHVFGPPRHREIMVQVWYPAAPAGQHLASYRTRQETTLLSSYMDVLWTHSYQDAPVASGAPFPVILFNPAWGGQRTQNTYQTEDLASHGFIVVGIDHPYNSGPVAFPDGHVVPIGTSPGISDFSDTSTLDGQIAIGDKEIHIQAADDILALNYLAAANSDPKSPWFQHVDADNAGAFGHSFGGAVSAQVCFQDSRVKAALNEDGWIFGDVLTHGLNKPYMIMSDDTPENPEDLHSANYQKRGVAQLNQIDEESIDRTMREFGGYFFPIRGAKHDNFRDRVLYSPVRRLTGSGTISPRRGHQIVESYTLQFFSHYLLGTPAPLLTENRNPYKEVQFENWFQKTAPTR